MEPDISLYTRQIETLCALAERQEMKLRPEQIREAFEASEVDTDCMLTVLRKLNEKGIRMETVISPEKTANGQSVQPESGRLSENGVTLIPLTEQDRRYLEDYVAGLNAFENDGNTSLIPFMEQAVRLAARLNCAELPLADLIQEANLAVLTMYDNGELTDTDPENFSGKIRESLEDVILQARKEKNADNSLVDRVTRFEKAVREINESDGEKFSIAELAVLLDMDIEEIKDILRLTGDAD